MFFLYCNMLQNADSLHRLKVESKRLVTYCTAPDNETQGAIISNAESC